MNQIHEPPFPAVPEVRTVYRLQVFTEAGEWRPVAQGKLDDMSALLDSYSRSLAFPKQFYRLVEVHESMVEVKRVETLSIHP